MTSKAQKEAEMMAAVQAYQKDTAKIAASIAKATKRAVAELMGDADAILSTFQRKGGFQSRAEAKACLEAPIAYTIRQRLIELARKTYTGKELERMLVRLSSQAYKYRIDNAKALQLSAKMHGDSLTKQVLATLAPATDRVVEEASSRTVYSTQREVGGSIQWERPNVSRLKAVQEEVGVYHKVKLFSAEELELARTRITAGILNGEQVDSIAQKVAEDTGKDIYKARRLVRTTMTQASADSTVKTLRDLGIDEYEIFCVLDEKTCPICGAYDGKKFKLSDPDAPRPTFHPNCRCFMRQVVPDDLKAKLKRSARDENGKSIPIPMSTTYAEWKATYGKKSAVPEPDHKKA